MPITKEKAIEIFMSVATEGDAGRVNAARREAHHRGLMEETIKLWVRMLNHRSFVLKKGFRQKNIAEENNDEQFSVHLECWSLAQTMDATGDEMIDMSYVVMFLDITV
eukprot:GEMP01070108.1.p1 GENE.GEMP01070108.1~~GEMP01070108.1.p1  ORF type:complete len:108 (+),score=11.37 GEMP01070108.1:254-577(+)